LKRIKHLEALKEEQRKHQMEKLRFVVFTPIQKHSPWILSDQQVDR